MRIFLGYDFFSKFYLEYVWYNVLTIYSLYIAKSYPIKLLTHAIAFRVYAYAAHKVKMEYIQNLTNNLNARKSIDMEVCSFFRYFLSRWLHLCLKRFKQMYTRVFLTEEHDAVVHFVVTLKHSTLLVNIC